MSETASVIQAIAELWKVGIVFLVAWGIYLFRDPIKLALGKLTQFVFKRGQTELRLDLTAIDQERVPKPSTDQIALPAPTTVETQQIPQQPIQPSAKELFKKMIRAFTSGNSADGDQAFQALQAATADAHERFKHEAFYWWLRFEHAQDTNALGKLVELSQRPEISTGAHYWIGNCYESAHEYQKAADAFFVSANGESDPGRRVSKLIDASRCLFKAGKQHEAFATLMHELTTTTDAMAKSALYGGLADLHKLAGDDELRAIAINKQLEGRPNDNSLRFSAAYSYSQGRLNALGFLHYKILIDFDNKEPSALNNLAVEYEHFKMPISAVSFYSKSADLDNTLSMANLAERYLSAGFTDEADSILTKALQRENPHKKVASVLEALRTNNEEEKKKEAELLKNGDQQQRFMLSFASGYFVKSEDISLAGEWKTAEGELIAITHKGDKISATWSSGKEENTLTGRVQNSAARIESKYDVKYSRTILAGGHRNSKGYTYLSDDREKLHVMNIFENGEHEIMTLSRC